MSCHRVPLAVVALVGLVATLSACRHTSHAFSPPARTAKAEPPTTPQEGEHELRGMAGIGSAPSGGEYHATMRYRHGLTRAVAVSAEAGLLDGSDKGRGFRHFFSGRGAAKAAPNFLGGQHFALEGGVGAVVGDLFRTVSTTVDAGAYLGFDNDYFIPWVHGWTFFSEPLVERESEWTTSGGSSCSGDRGCVHKIRTRRSIGWGWQAGFSVPVGRSGSKMPNYRFTLGVGREIWEPLRAASIESDPAPAPSWEGIARIDLSIGIAHRF